MDRTTLMIAAWLLMVNANAQDVPPTTRPTTSQKDPNSTVPREPLGRGPGNAPVAGNPRVQSDTIGAPLMPDTAFNSILLDRSQAQRIQQMDRRYSEELQGLGTSDRNDPRYRALWTRRSREIEDILTPVQYKRWQELNADHAAPPPPVDMPVARPTEEQAPMPVLRPDSVHDNMPVIQDGQRTQPPPQKR